MTLRGRSPGVAALLLIVFPLGGCSSSERKAELAAREAAIRRLESAVDYCGSAVGAG